MRQRENINVYFSVINVSTYAWICYGNKLYGEAMVNAFYFLPMNITGFILWRKHRSGTEVKTRNLSVRGLVILAVITVITVAAYWQALKFLQGSLPLIDSMTTIIAIIALFLQVMRYSEQWLLWITVNAISILLWIIMMIQGDNSGKTMVVMWSAYFVNSIYGYINWKKLANTQA